MMSDSRTNLLDMTPAEITELCLSLGEKPYRGRQAAAWVFRRGAGSIEEMTDISAKFRLRLSQAAFIARPEILEVVEDEDAAQKILWRLHDGRLLESVLIPEKDHLTLCVSSQVGCALGCRFCRTGETGFSRDLSSGEIVGQLLGARELAGRAPLTNIVFMGMGEPLLNRVNVVRSLGIITDPELTAVSGKHISLSTAGITPELGPLAREAGRIGLTVSLSAATDELRSQIMPVNRAYPLAELKKALLDWPLARGRRLTIAYVLLGGVNDREEQALALSRYLAGLKVKINLIPFNVWPGAPYRAPGRESVERFKNVLTDKNHTVMIRWSKGGRVSAACGQLHAGRTRPEEK